MINTMGGVTKTSFVDFSVRKISILQRYLSDYLNHNYIWQVPPQLNCGDTCQLQTCYSVAILCFDNAEEKGK